MLGKCSAHGTRQFFLYWCMNCKINFQYFSESRTIVIRQHGISTRGPIKIFNSVLVNQIITISLPAVPTFSLRSYATRSAIDTAAILLGWVQIIRHGSPLRECSSNMNWGTWVVFPGKFYENLMKKCPNYCRQISYLNQYRPK